MRILFDQNISFRSVNNLHTTFPEAKHVKEFDLQHATDRKIWDFAKENQYTIVTFDSDFYDLVTQNSSPIHPSSANGWIKIIKRQQN